MSVANISSSKKTPQPAETQLLFTISEALLGARTVTDLFKTIVTLIKPIFNFYDTGILIQEGDFFYDLSVMNTDIDGSPVNNYLNNAGFYREHGFLVKGSSFENLKKVITGTNHPEVYDYTTDQSIYSDAPILNAIKQSGYKKALCYTLKDREYVTGLFFINYMEEKFPDKSKFPLFKSITEQVSISVQNLLFYEEIRIREYEKIQLLEISEAIARVRQRNDLLQIIYRHVKNILPYFSSGLFIIDEEHDFHQMIISQETIGVAGLRSGTTDKLPHRGSPVEFAASQFAITSYKDIRKRFEHPHFEIIDSWGVEEMIHGPIKYGEKTIGMLCLWAEKTGTYNTAHLALFKSICNQFAIAISNILANEEIERKSYEKSQLLSISESISNIRDRKELISQIFEKVKPLIPHDDVGLCIFSNDGSEWIDWAVADNYTNTITNEQLKQFGLSGFQPMDSLNEKAIKGTGVISKEEIKIHHKDLTFYPVLINGPIEHYLYTPLIFGSRVLGVLYFDSVTPHFYTPECFPLVKEVANLVAPAVSNILAMEELTRREQDKTLQLEINECFAESKPISTIWPQLTGTLSMRFDFDMMILKIMKAEELYDFLIVQRTAFNEFNSISKEDFFKHIGVTSKKFSDIIKQIGEPAEFVINNETDRKALSKTYNIIKEVCKFYRMQSCMLHKMATDIGYRFSITCFSRKENQFTESLVSQFESLKEIIHKGIIQILSYEEIKVLGQRLKDENAYLSEEVHRNYNFEEIIGNSPALTAVFEKAGQVARTDTTVLIEGETGTGKELFARAIHNISKRKNKIFVKVNCAAIPEQLIESELFGHEKGAFTGALEKRIGKFELANGGTIFLDEIGELPLPLQSKLLRVIQEREIERLGGNGTINLDIRIIAATNRQLAKEVQKGTFRHDLYFRLSVFPLYLPPLRERKEDIPLLIKHFTSKYAYKIGKNIKSVSQNMLEQLLQYHFPGNIRELEHIIENAVITSNKSKLELGRILYDEKRQVSNLEQFTIRTMEEMERGYIMEVLKRTGHRIKGPGGAADLLGLKASTLNSKIKKLGIKREHVVKPD